MRYKVVNFFGKARVNPDETRWDAHELMIDYGLQEYYTPEEVQLLWEDYSDSYAAGWLTPSPDRVERVFNVRLEPVESDEDEEGN